MREKPTYEELEKRVRELEAAQSQWKRTEAALRESEARYHAIFEQAAVGIGSAHSAGTILDANQALCEMLGYSEEELVGRSVSDITLPEDGEKERQLIDEVIAGKRDAFHLEKRLLHKKGHPVWVHHSSNVVRLGGDEEYFAIGVSMDITQRKRAEEALEKMRDLLDQTGRMARVGGWELDADTLAVTWTRETFRIHGVSPDVEPALDEAIDFYHPDDRPRLRAAIERGLSDGEPFDMMLRFFTAEGKERWVRLMGGPVFAEGRISKLFGAFQDVTDRKMAEAALRKNRDMLAHAERLANIGSWEWEVAADAVAWSEQLYRIVGLAPENEAMRWDEQGSLYPPEDFERLSRAVDFAVNEGESYELEIQIIRMDGQTRHCIAQGFPEMGTDGCAFRLFGSLQDITERKQGQEALKWSEERLRTVLESMGDAVYVHDFEGCFLMVNEAACRQTGYRRDELLRKSVADIAPKSPLKEKWPKFGANAQPEGPIHIESEHMRRDGSVYPVEISVTRIFMPDGPAILALARDITDRKRAEHALRESESRFRAIFEQAAAGIATATAEGRFLEANQTLCDMLGYSAEELRGISVYDLTFPDDREKQLDIDKPVLEGENDTVRMEKRFLHKDGHPVWANLASNVVRDEDGNIQYVIGVVVDIDQRKRMEAALLEALEEKEILLREIHHRTKNNMQTIVSLLRIYSRMEPGATFQSVFEDCRGRIEAMALVHEALYQSNDLVRIHFQTYLQKLCRNLARVHAARINGISVEVASTGISLNMDQGIAVGMVIAELISNAFKHAFPSGKAGKVAIGITQPEAGMVELSVSDNGVGLPPDLNIHRPENLGLQLVSGTVQRELGGTLDLKRNGGAAFIVRFPFAQR